MKTKSIIFTAFLIGLIADIILTSNFGIAYIIAMLLLDASALVFAKKTHYISKVLFLLNGKIAF